jgi:RNA polymerase sigma-70 factor (ECF subfamily)
MVLAEASPEADERELMRAIAVDRDRAAFSRLFAQYAPKVKAFLLRGGLQNAVSEELVQDVMLILWRRAETYDPAQASLSTWIYTIARNRRADYFRRSREIGAEATESVEESDPDAATDRIIEQRQQHERLRAAVATLPVEQADVLRRAFFEHKSHSEIASECGLPLGTIKSRIRLAMRHLRGVLEEKDG